MLSALLLAAVLQDPAPDWGTCSPDELVAEVQRERDRVDPAVLSELGRRGTGEALSALRRCSAILNSEEGLNRAFAAVGALVREPQQAEVGDAARAFLLAAAIGESWAHRRPATRALADLGGQVEAELRRVLTEAPDPRCRQLACGGLVPALELQGDPAALALLLAWYRSPTSGPPARLVRALAGLRGDWVLEALEVALADRALPPSVRAVLFASLAVREEPRAHELVLVGLEDSDPAVQVAAIEASADLGDRGQARTLERLTRSRDESVRSAAFIALDHLRAGDAEWEDEVMEAASDRDVALRLAAVEALARRPGEAGLVALLELLQDESHLVRGAAVRALRSRRAPRSVPALIEVLEADTLRVRELAREVLVELTALDHGASSRRWRAWWEAEGAGFSLPEAPEAAAANALREARLARSPTQAAFFGIPLGSDRVCFVVDTSGSMDGGVESGGTRLAAAVDELVGALEGYPAGGRFNLVFFAGRVRAWKSSLVEMDAKRLLQARRFVRAQRAKGGTALHDGLVAALEDGEVDTVVVLSDGQPTEGALTDPEDILADIRHRTRLRGVVIHCVALSFRSDLLAGLAAATGGTYREVR